MLGRGSGSSSLLESAARIMLLARLASLLSRRSARCSATAATTPALLAVWLPAAVVLALLARAGGDGLLLRRAKSLPADESLVSPPTREERM
jgi:hypothetical protein